jgi:site-specific DNA recombinase
VTKEPIPAASYARISEKAERDKVTDQHRQNEAHAAARGYRIIARFTDDGISALGHKERPDFERMLIAAANGEFKAIIATEEERLARNVEEKLELHTACEGYGIVWDTARDGYVDPSTDSGEFMSTIRAAMGRIESKRKARRQVAANIERANEGLPVPGKRRFGFERGNILEHPTEGDMVRSFYRGLLDGKAIRSMALAQNLRPIRVREILTNPAYAGWVVRRGERFEAHESVARLVERSEWERAQAILTDPSRRVSPGGTRKHLITGLANCGECGAALHYSAHGYKCSLATDHVFIKGTERMEAAVSRAAVAELAHRALNGSPNPEGNHVDALREELATVTAERSRLSALLVDPEIDPQPIRSALKPVRERLEALTVQIAEAEAASVEARILSGLRLRVLAEVREQMSRTETQTEEAGLTYKPSETVRKVAQLRVARKAAGDAWAELDLDDRRALIRGMLTVILEKGRTLERIKIAPTR